MENWDGSNYYYRLTHFIIWARLSPFSEHATEPLVAIADLINYSIVTPIVGVINNKRNTIWLAVYAKTLLIDNNGNQYSASELSFGTKVDTHGVAQYVPPGIPMNLGLLFKNVVPAATSVNLMITTGDEGNPILRNIPLTR